MIGHSADTIFALAAGQTGRSAVSVLRISGPLAGRVLRDLTQRDLPEPRRASLRRLLGADDEVLDEALVLWMPGPASFTGEDCVELHLHGGGAIRAAVLARLSACEGLRAAEPGEFTRRAFTAGRMDLTAVEALADLIDAETEGQRRQAMRQLRGALFERVSAWKLRLLDSLALIEASLDFADEDDIPDLVTDEIAATLSDVARAIEEVLGEAVRGERIREGYRVVIAGAPNAGKSTLLNAIARRDVAIVSAIPGTTRDVIEVRCDLDGLPVILADTAGLRETQDAIEQIGVERARSEIRDADLLLWLIAGDAPVSAETPPADALIVHTKADLACTEIAADCRISARTGEGLRDLLTEIARRLGGVPAEPALATRERHRVALQEAKACLARALSALHKGATELAAEDVRLALRAIGRIVGAVDVEDVLDRVFSQFCIGK